MDGAEIRTATLADHDAVREVRRRSSLSNAGDRDNLLANPETLEYDATPLREGRTRVAVVDDRVIGLATTLPTEEGLELEALFVDPEWMRRGIGRELVLDVVDAARASGIGRVDVTANQHALAFYESVGFVSDGEIATRFGPAPRMRLDLVERSP